MDRESLTLYLVRHPETISISNGIIQGGGSDSPLSELGLQQALQLRSFFQTVPLQAVYSSTLLRCKDIAELIVKERPVPLLLEQNLVEGTLGEWEGLPFEETSRRFEEMGTRNAYVAPPGAESVWSIRGRVERFLETVLKEQNGHVALITHGGIVRVMLGVLLGLPRETPWRGYPFVLENGSISIVEVERAVPSQEITRFVIRRVNDTSHLQSAGVTNSAAAEVLAKGRSLDQAEVPAPKAADA